jgi:hypothetical protein
MTIHSRPSGAGPDGRDLTLALLAARLSELSEHAGRLASRLDAAEAAITGQAGTLAEAAGLAQEVTRLSAAIAGHGAPPAARYVPAHPRQPVWAAMNDTEHADALRDLARWVSSILLRRYPAAAPVLPPCWPAHPAAVEELDWLYWDWTTWALEPAARSRDAADWHDRWLPGVLARIAPELASCAKNGRHAPRPHQRAVPAELAIAGHAPEAVFIEQMPRAAGGPRQHPPAGDDGRSGARPRPQGTPGRPGQGS